MSERPSTIAAITTGTFTRSTEPHQNRSSIQPPSAGPSPKPRPATADQIAIARARSPAGNTFVRIDSVAGMMRAPPIPMNARVAMSWPGGSAEAPRREQQPGEDQDVGVDDPLQLGRRCSELAHERRKRHVHDRVVQRDHEQRQDEDPEGPPPLLVGLHPLHLRSLLLPYGVHLRRQYRHTT